MMHLEDVYDSVPRQTACPQRHLHKHMGQICCKIKILLLGAAIDDLFDSQITVSLGLSHPASHEHPD